MAANKPKKRIFRVELGINLHAAPVPQTNPNMRIFPLQNALIDVTDGDDQPKPAWYAHLGIGDEISFRVVDISKLRGDGETEYPDLVLAEFFFNNPNTGRSVNPFDQEVISWRFADRGPDQPSPPYSLDGCEFPVWDMVPHNALGKPIESLEFADFPKAERGMGFRAYELTVVLKLYREGWVNHYVFDPEMIVSETDNEGDGSGF